ncbi:hypothetical protein [Oleiharenicola lentus]|uniref:hypothetical protein n=1 Tax=Oleiharenicola lentus TaxID=2508720 RepID=UPI003F67AD45
MWLRGLLLGLGFALAFVSLRANERAAAFQAQALLGSGVWSEVVKIKNTRPNAAFPAVVYALVFELEGRLWLYAANTGTESLSLQRGRLAQDKANYGPLLREISRGFERYTIVEPRESDDIEPLRPLPHGCFIQSIAYLRRLTGAGVDLGEARLLAYYVTSGAGQRGHTVLYFERDGRRYYFDPEIPATARPIPDDVATRAIDIARATVPKSGFALPDRAVFFPLKVPVTGAVHKAIARPSLE